MVCSAQQTNQHYPTHQPHTVHTHNIRTHIHTYAHMQHHTYALTQHTHIRTHTHVICDVDISLCMRNVCISVSYAHTHAKTQTEREDTPMRTYMPTLTYTDKKNLTICFFQKHNTHRCSLVWLVFHLVQPVHMRVILLRTYIVAEYHTTSTTHIHTHSHIYNNFYT